MFPALALHPHVIHPLAISGPSYNSMSRRLADQYLIKNEELKAIFHLTEAHAATLRRQTIVRYDLKEDILKNPSVSESKKLTVAHGIEKKYIEFRSELALQEEKGLLSRLRELPKEWTVVQLTRQVDPTERLKIRQKDSPVNPTCLHITRLPCGSALDESAPLNVMVAKPRHSEGMPTIFEIIISATNKLRTKRENPKVIREAREAASEEIKAVVEALSKDYLREWRCLLLGTLCNPQYKAQVRACVDQVLASDSHKSYNLDSRGRQMLYSIADAAVHLTLAEIQSGVGTVVDCVDLYRDLVAAIEAFKNELPVLLAVNRHPVILIVDEALDNMPWESIAVLKKHPVSRVPSIHFLHALFHLHKEHIVDGCRLVRQLDLGYYVINPDQDLKDMEARLSKFLQQRMPQWKGTCGVRPEKSSISNALSSHEIFLYCGHHNGTHILHGDDVSNLRVVALPMLFGCSSVALQEVGGRTQPTGVTDKYITAGCACVIGMLWTVTSDDTDCMTVIMLNSWLPGEPVDLTTFRRSGDMLTPHAQPELLRTMRYAREVAHVYSNSAALIARGIPIKMVCD